MLGVVGGAIAGLGTGSFLLVAIGVALKCLGSAPACYLILAMLADVIDHIEFKGGIRTDGLTMSIYSSSEQSAQKRLAGEHLCGELRDKNSTAI